jgi:predicted nucleic acid-binding protein
VTSFAGQPVVLDSEGLARAVLRDVYMRAVIQEARDSLSPVIVSAATLVEVVHPKTDEAALNWTLSTLTVESVSKDVALRAARLLKTARLHGHRAAIDAMVCATALQAGTMPTIYTSDPDDIRALVGKQAVIVPLR